MKGYLSKMQVLQEVIQQIESNVTVTWNGDKAYASTEDSRLDLFFKGLVRNSRIQEPGTKLRTRAGRGHGQHSYAFVQSQPNTELYRMVQESWSISPEHTLQLILHARDCRGGKGEKFVSLDAMFWLRKNKPMTYLLNLDKLISVGCYKDLLKLATWSKPAMKEGTNQLLQRDNIPIELWYLAEIIKDDHARVVEFETLPAPDREKQKSPNGLTLAAKWAPSENKKYDELAVAMATILFGNHPQKLKLYRNFINKIRGYNNIVERQMCSNEWNDIHFESVPSKAHLLLKNTFKKHCPEYEIYLENVKQQKTTIKTGTLHPHEIVDCYYDTHELDQTVENMWVDMRSKFDTELFKDAIAVSDVSGSMTCNKCIPMKVSIALGLLIAELAGHQRVITFDSHPALIQLNETHTTFQKYQQIRHAPWGGSTNLVGTFELVLRAFTNQNRPKTIFIFSDMQFNSAVGRSDYSSYERIKQMYQAQNAVLPQIIFWNLNGSISGCPVTKDERGTFIISGYSAQLMKEILQGNLQVKTSLDMMLECIGK